MKDKHDNQFQLGLLANLLQSKRLGVEFIEQKKMPSTAFSKPWMQTVWGWTNDHYKKYKEWPTKDLMFQELTKLQDDENLTKDELAIVEEFIIMMLNESQLNPIYFKVEGERFLEKRLAKKILRQSLDESEETGTIEIDKVISDLGDIRRRTRSQHIRSIDPFEKTILSDVGNCVPTGIVGIDSRLPGGGHMEKRTMLCIGFTSGGKSTLLRTMELNAALSGKKVLIITLEDSASEVAEKLYGNAAGIPVTLLQRKDQRTPEILARIEESRAALKGHIRIIDPYDPDTNDVTTARATTVGDIESIIEMEGNNGFEPDIITIDYLNRIGVDDEDGMLKDEGQKLRRISELLKDRLAKKFKKPITTCAQANADGYGAAVMELVNMARGKEAAWAFDVIVTLGTAMGLDETMDKKELEKADRDLEREVQEMAYRITIDDLIKGRCPVKRVFLKLAKVRGGHVGTFPIYADFCYGRFAEPGSMIRTISGLQSVEQVVDMQMKQQIELKVEAERKRNK